MQPVDEGVEWEKYDPKSTVVGIVAHRSKK